MKNKWIIGAATVILIGGGAFSVSALTNEEPVKLTEEEATSVVQEEMEGFTVDRVERDDEDGRAMFEVKGRTAEGKQLDVDVDANEGHIVDVDREDDSEEQEPAPEVTLSKEEAKKIAKEKGSGSITEFEVDDGHYEVEMEEGQTEYEMKIDGQSGEVLEFEKE